MENCRIHDFNRIEKSYRPGVWIDGVGNRVSQCDIYNAPSMAILFHGNNHVLNIVRLRMFVVKWMIKEQFITDVIRRSKAMSFGIVISIS